MREDRHLAALVVPQTLENPCVLRSNISFDDVLHEFYLFDTVLQSVQLRDDLVTLINQVGPNCLNEVELSEPVCVSHLQNSVQLNGIKSTWLL